MGLNNPKSGLNATSEYTISGLPWVYSDTISDTIVRYSFPKITKDVLIINNNTAANQRLRVGFTYNGISGSVEANYIIINGGSDITLNVRVKDLYLLRDGGTDISTSVCANLTMIDSIMMPILTGSIGGTICWEGIG